MPLQVGVVNSSRVGPDDLKTLKKLSFQVKVYSLASALFCCNATLFDTITLFLIS